MEGSDKQSNSTFQIPPSTPPLVVIVGPTASGKTALAIDIARKYQGEIICADSRTVYKWLDIGTAKPSQAEQAAIPHHLLDVVGPDEPFTAVDFKRLTLEAIEDISTRGKLPIMVGGSGLYIDAVLFNYGFSDQSTPRDRLNPRHSHADAPKHRSPLRKNTVILGITVERADLKKRIESRIEHMVANGFADEVRWLQANYPDSKASLAPGYKAFTDYIHRRVSLEEAKQKFIRNDMALAKRQMTWFKRNNSIHWISNSGEADDILTTKLNKKD